MKSLYFRVFVIILYTVALSSVLGFSVSNAYYHWKLKPLHDAKMIGIAEDARTFVEQYPEAVGDYMRNASSLGYQIYLTDRTGREFYFGHSFRKKNLALDVREQVLAGNVYHGIAHYPDSPFLTGYFENGLSNTVGVPLQISGMNYAMFLRPDVRLQFGELRVFFALIFVFTVAFSIPSFLLSTRYLVQPVTQLTEATKRLAQGEYKIRLNTNRRDEIGQLARHFETMSRELERSDLAKRDFVANVSHEIHTPLSSIQGFADILQQPELDAATRIEYAYIVGQEARRLAEMSRQLLLLSTLDRADGERLDKREHPLRRQLQHALRLMQWQLSEKQLSVKLSVPPSLTIRGDEALLHQVWTNLLFNAIRHIPDERSIAVRALEAGGACVVEVSDTGDGIPEDQLPYIYDRFYRGDGSRSRSSGGTGLGLSIVQAIVHRHGGTIQAFSRIGEGTTFRVTIPG
ncbi:sensor histidine kinase [Cohnella sp. GCM10020058]|uniref:sensor histidine kinase n=1 Tax=Cohnella sp. GCM10020058 TaxID=3317330 RepID=UPI0036349C0E